MLRAYRTLLFIFAGLVVTIVLAPEAAYGEILQRLERPRSGELLSCGLNITAPVELSVEAVGVIAKLSDQYFVHAWLLDRQTRQSVWSLDARERESLPDSRLLRQASEKISLPPGEYALYLYAGTRYRTGEPFRSWSSVLSDIADLINSEDPGDNLPEYLDRCHVTLSGGPAAQAAVVPRALSGWPEAVISCAPAGSDTFFSQAFRAVQDTEVRIYAMGESGRTVRGGGLGKAQDEWGRMYDYGWIEKIPGGEIVWEIDWQNTRPAGGAGKNRLFDGTVRLPEGNYLACYLTDGSHAAGDWNATPPADPEGWGLTFLPSSAGTEAHIALLKESDLPEDPDLLVSMLRVRDDEHRRQTFTLDASARLHIRAVGEGDDGEMHDHGWIINQDSGETIWRMRWHDTESAGGARKNRLFAGEIELSAGRYEAHYQTDGSHAFGGWNENRPYQPHNWGMVVRRVAGS